MCPDGIIAQMKGPWIGSRNDCGMLNESQLIDILSAHFNDGDVPIVLYGDPIYSFTSHIWSGFKGARLTEGEEQFNKTLSLVRESVEWGFGKVITYFAWLDFAKNQKMFLQPVAKYYVIGAFLTNCHTCLYGSQTSQYFDLDPPSLEHYLTGAIKV